MNFIINETIQNILIELFKIAFSNNNDFKYISDLDTTEINFFRTYPKLLPAYPVVIVLPPSIDDIPRTMGNDLIKEQFGSWGVLDGVCNQTFGGMFEADVDIGVYGRTSSEREKILDWLISYLRHIYREYLESFSIDIRDIRRGSETVEVYGSELIYISHINIKVFIEWQRILNVESILNNIHNDINVIASDGSVDGLSTDII